MIYRGPIAFLRRRSSDGREIERLEVPMDPVSVFVYGDAWSTPRGRLLSVSLEIAYGRSDRLPWIMVTGEIDFPVDLGPRVGVGVDLTLIDVRQSGIGSTSIVSGRLTGCHLFVETGKLSDPRPASSPSLPSPAWPECVLERSL